MLKKTEENEEPRSGKREQGEVAEDFRLLVEAVQDYAIFIMDPAGRIVTWNSGAERLKGYRAEEIIGRNFSCFYPAEEIEKGSPEAELKTAAAEGRIETEGLRVRKDGSRFWAHVSITALRNEKGGLRGFCKITRDITERKEAEEAMRNSHHTAISELLESISDSFVAFDRDWRYVRVNSAASKLLHKTPDELLGKVLWDVFPEAQRLKFGTEYRQAMDGNVSVRFEEFYPAPLNTWFECRCHPSANGLNVFFTDITERKKAQTALMEAKQSAEQANKAKDIFLATLSHELRTPLTPVLLTASTLEGDETLSADLRAQFSLIRSNIELESRLIDDLLDITKIAHGKFSIRRQNLNASNLLSTTLEIVRADYLGKGLTVQSHSAARFTTVHADPARLQQVFWNLLKNAVKFTPAGGHIDIRTFNPDPQSLAIEIQDTGIGIAPASLKEIFQPFQQVAATGKPQFGGLGLGLSISKNIVEVLGGTITAASGGPHHGTTFTIRLPLCESAGDAATAPANTGESPPTPRRILLVEDHQPTRAVLARLLRKEGHQVEAAGSCAEALNAVHSQPAGEPFQALVCDLGLPDGSGLDIVRELKAVTPGIAAIALSGFGTDDDIRRSREAGFDEHLVKPASIQELRRALAA